MTDRPRRKRMLEGRGVLHVVDAARQLGVRADDLAAIVEAGQLPGGMTLEDGTALGLLEGDLPSHERLLELGARPADDLEDTYVPPPVLAWPTGTPVSTLRWGPPRSPDLPQ